MLGTVLGQGDTQSQGGLWSGRRGEVEAAWQGREGVTRLDGVTRSRLLDEIEAAGRGQVITRRGGNARRANRVNGE